MKIEEPQRQELIQQIANNLTGSFISCSVQGGETKGLLYNIIINGEILFALKECNCIPLSRNSNNFRSELENFICNFIINSYDKQQPINLINIGSDFTGITIILAKLYLKGYKTINLSVVDKDYIHSDHRKHLDFWETLFLDELTVNDVHDLIHEHAIDAHICNNRLFSLQPYRLFMQSNMIVFAEDAGSSLCYNRTVLNNFIAGIKQARVHNFVLAQSPAGNKKHKKTSNPIIQNAISTIENAIRTGMFEQKIFVINAEESNGSKKIVFDVKCTTLNIYQINDKWEICDKTQSIATGSNNEYHHFTIDPEQNPILPDNKAPFNQHESRIAPPSLPLLFSDLTTTSNQHFNDQTEQDFFLALRLQAEADQDFAQKLQAAEQQNFALAKSLQEQADRAFALSL